MTCEPRGRCCGYAGTARHIGRQHRPAHRPTRARSSVQTLPVAVCPTAAGSACRYVRCRASGTVGFDPYHPLRKPHDSGTTPNRAFLAGFPAIQFPDFCLCRCSAVFMTVLGCLSLHPEIPFPVAVLGREFNTNRASNSSRSRRVISNMPPGPRVTVKGSNRRQPVVTNLIEDGDGKLIWPMMRMQAQVIGS